VPFIPAGARVGECADCGEDVPLLAGLEISLPLQPTRLRCSRRIIERVRFGSSDNGVRRDLASCLTSTRQYEYLGRNVSDQTEGTWTFIYLVVASTQLLVHRMCKVVRRTGIPSRSAQGIIDLHLSLVDRTLEKAMSSELNHARTLERLDSPP
jgi:hypothetical protein